jgi:hypothetical protein
MSIPHFPAIWVYKKPLSLERPFLPRSTSAPFISAQFTDSPPFTLSGDIQQSKSFPAVMVTVGLWSFGMTACQLSHAQQKIRIEIIAIVVFPNLIFNLFLTGRPFSPSIVQLTSLYPGPISVIMIISENSAVQTLIGPAGICQGTRNISLIYPMSASSFTKSPLSISNRYKDL